jgi:cyanophycin synthetase
VQSTPGDAIQGELIRLVVVGGAVAAAFSGEQDITDQLHPDITQHALAAARIIGLDIAGVGIRASHIDQPLASQQGGIIDVHANPDAAGERVAKAIVSYLFPQNEDGRIPIACVTGVNGKTTTTRLIAHLVRCWGLKTGLTSSDGVYIDGQRIEAGDCSGPKSARTILRHPQIEAGVFEVARGGILREGLGFDRADVSVVTNIGEGDHLGIGYINTVEDLAYVKSTVVDAVRPEGTAVLNAADPLTAAMHQSCRGKVTYFALDAMNQVIVAHRENEGAAAFARDGQLIIAQGAQETLILPLAEIPLTHGGRIGFQIENVLAATAAAWALGIPLDVIQRGLRTFGTEKSQTPGRFNVLQRGDSTIILDFGHNPSAVASLVASLDRFCHAKRTAVYGADGDRRDDQIIRQAEVLAGAFDRVILYEEPSRMRGRPTGECYRLLEQGLASAPRARHIARIDGERAAIESAICGLGANELLLIQVDAVDADLSFVDELLKA